MTWRKTLVFGLGEAVCLALVMAANAPAASSLTNSLKGFTGDSSLVDTQAALNAAGFNFASTAGSTTGSDPRIVFNTSGATAGSFRAGDAGRNYLRTNEIDYATVDFVAEVTVTVDTLGTDQFFFGMGTGAIGTWNVPDMFSVQSSIFMTPETPPIGPGDYNRNLAVDAADYTIWRDTLGVVSDGVDPPEDLRANGDNTGASLDRIDNADYDFWKLHFGEIPTGPGHLKSLFQADAAWTGCPPNNDWCDTPTPLLQNTAGVHRLRMTYDASAKTWQGAVDVNYTGGPFVADVSTQVFDLTPGYTSDFFGTSGWEDVFANPPNTLPNEPSAIYFGGDDGAIFSDFSVVVSGPGGGSIGVVVPEPSSLVLIFGVLVGGLGLRRQR